MTRKVPAAAANDSDTAMRLWDTQNPHFFEGSRVAKEAAAGLAAAETPIPAAAE